MIKICTDYVLKGNRKIEAARLAVEENPENKFIPMFGVSHTPMKMALVTGKKWKPGRVINCKFLDGDPAVQDLVIKKAKIWEGYANLKLNFIDRGKADVQITFTKEGSWSTVGTDCLVFEDGEPTMNFGWLNRTTPEIEYDRVVKHEFGHMLGCIHEHQHPETALKWNKDLVYKYFSGPPNNWSKEEIKYNIFQRYSVRQTNFSEYDPTSIMHYSIPAELLMNQPSTPWNSQLSNIDKTFIRKVYHW